MLRKLAELDLLSRSSTSTHPEKNKLVKTASSDGNEEDLLTGE